MVIFKAQIGIPRRPVFTPLGLQIQEAQCSLPEEKQASKHSVLQMMQPEITRASYVPNCHLPTRAPGLVETALEIL